MKQSKFYLLLVLSIIAVIPIYPVFGSEFSFSVTPKIPENQIDKTKSYFDLRMQQGTEQIIQVDLYNAANQNVTVEASIHSATTNLNGVVEYGSNNIKKDETLKYDLKELTTTESEIVIPPTSTKTLDIHVKMPDEAFDGVIAGGITFKEKETASEQALGKDSKDKNGGMAIENKFSYVVALLLSQNDKEVIPNLVLQDATAGQVNVRNVINATIQNPEPVYIKDLNLTTKITKKGSDDVIYSRKAEKLQVAPNSNFTFPTALSGEKLVAGEYTMSVDAYSGKSIDGKYQAMANGEDVTYRYHWALKKDFSISDKNAKKYNEQDVSIERTDMSKWYLIIAILVLIILLLIIIYFIKYRKIKKEEQDPSL